MDESNEEHFDGKIALKAIVVKDNKVLLVQDPRGHKDTWEIPGGRMNIEEEPKEAVAREFYEEMGAKIKVGDVVYMEQFIQSNENARAFVIVFEATLINEDVTFSVPNEEVSAVGWFEESEIQNLNLYEEYKRALGAYFK